jgi:hypothetical protein
MPYLAHQTPTKSHCLFDEKLSLPLIYISPDGEGLQAIAWLWKGVGLCIIGPEATGFCSPNREGKRTPLHSPGHLHQSFGRDLLYNAKQS